MMRGARDEGSALIMVIGIGMVVLLLVASALSMSVSGVVKATRDQNWNGAIEAAYAGIAEYESRIANDSSYMYFGNPNAPFSDGSPVTLPTGSQENAAFGIGVTGTWASVAGSDATAAYRYEVDNSDYATSGVLRLRVTGKVGQQTRSVVANLKQEGFIDFLYFTDYEIQDPDQSGVSVANCVVYAWAGRPSGCSEIAFGGGDVINGPVHSNDTLRICTSTFNGPVTTGYAAPSGLSYLAKDSNGTACSGQVFNSGLPTYAPVVAMPATNSQMKKETRSDLPADVARPGCLYTGPTSVVLASNGTMTIRSPWTKKTQVAGDPATSGSTPAACGTPGAATGGLGSSTGATIAVLDRNLIYVQNVPTVASDPNYWPTTGALPTDCTSGNGIGFPMAGEYVVSIPTSYGCRKGDVFVKGTVKGELTIAAENYAYVTGDIVYSASQVDILGLVGQNAVWVWNPISRSCTGACSPTYASLLADNRRIDAALLSVAHTFQVQNYSRGGSQGVLTVNGTISQKFRGIIRSGTNGYTKSYSYDQRYRYVAPPKFLSPVSTTYGVSVLVEVPSAFSETGAATP
jgi:hypothetical protein